MEIRRNLDVPIVFFISMDLFRLVVDYVNYSWIHLSKVFNYFNKKISFLQYKWPYHLHYCDDWSPRLKSLFPSIVHLNNISHHFCFDVLGSIPAEFYKQSRIVYFCTSMMTYVMYAAFSSYAIILMMNKKYDLPFSGLKSLIQDSSYRVVASNNSLAHKYFQVYS